MLQASLAALPDDTTLDSKIAITLLDPTTTTTSSSASPLLPTLSLSAWSSSVDRNGGDGEGGVDDGEMGNMFEEEEEEEEEEEKDCGTLDKMMCDIVDAMN